MSTPMPDLHGAAFVTGAARGLGAAYAERLALRGRDLILVASDRSALERVAERLRPGGTRIEIVVADLARAEDLAAVETQLRGDDRIAVLVNDADAGHAADAHQRSEIPHTGVGTATRLARAAAESFSAQRHGTILNVALASDAPSGPTLRGRDDSLARLVAFGRALRDELLPHGVHVKTRLHRRPASDSSGTRSTRA